MRTRVSNVCQNIFVFLESVENELLEMIKLSALSFSFFVHTEHPALSDNFHIQVEKGKRMFIELHTDREMHNSS